eukprot:m.422311 g.422311  ORF g.422311 m.422311 type:complete len:335 (+) comp20198_c4_seq18:74-1078(+)
MVDGRVANLRVFSGFDGGNLASVSLSRGSSVPCGSLVTPGSPDADADASVPATVEIDGWTRPDALGTPFCNNCRTWFYFGVQGGRQGQVLRVNMYGMNKQGKLYRQGHSPAVRVLATVPGGKQRRLTRWSNPCFDLSYGTVADGSAEGDGSDDSDDGDGDEGGALSSSSSVPGGYRAGAPGFVLSWSYRFAELASCRAEGQELEDAPIVYFAFSFPFSYQEYQDWFSRLDTTLGRDNWFGIAEQEEAQNSSDTHDGTSKGCTHTGPSTERQGARGQTLQVAQLLRGRRGRPTRWPAVRARLSHHRLEGCPRRQTLFIITANASCARSMGCAWIS